jgi:hypothetical protein
MNNKIKMYQKRYKTRMHNLISKMVGKRFSNLTIIEFAYIKQGNSYWKCKCDCGREKIIAGHLLKDGQTTSCGCSRIYKNAIGESGLKSLYTRYKVEAKMRKKSFNLTIKEFKELTSKNCVYCGSEPCKFSTTRYTRDINLKAYTIYKYNGIDRINSTKGYEKGNVAPCCIWCNIAKRDKTVEEFRDHIVKIYNHLNSR